MAKKELLLCCILIFIGMLDWLTTIAAIVFFGATEANPLLAGMTQTNLVLFSVVKISAITLTGLVFYKALTTAKLAPQISPFAKKFLKSGYAIALVSLAILVSNNMIVVAQSA
jgi:hypothetical protein